MTNTETQINIRNRVINVSVDGLSELEISSIGAKVEEKIKQIEKLTDIPDTSKLAIRAAFEFAVELHILEQKSQAAGEADGRKIDEILAKLEKTMAGKK